MFSPAVGGWVQHHRLHLFPPFLMRKKRKQQICSRNGRARERERERGELSTEMGERVEERRELCLVTERS